MAAGRNSRRGFVRVHFLGTTDWYPFDSDFAVALPARFLNTFSMSFGAESDRSQLRIEHSNKSSDGRLSERECQRQARVRLR
jgi:hypothetical protein